MISSESNDDNLCLSASANLLLLMSDSFPNRIRAHPVNQLRQKLGEYQYLLPQLKEDEERFHNYIRMSRETFKYILDKLEPLLNVNNFKNCHASPILAEERLVVSIR